MSSSGAPPKNRLVRMILLGIVLLLSASASLLTFRTPNAAPAAAPSSEFSAERAMSHISATCQNAHPIGSDEILRVRDYIVGQIEGMGLVPHMQKTRVPDYYGTAATKDVEISNIYAVLRGTGSTGSIVLAGHYDTVPESPGASDDGSAVAVLLETTRSLLSNPSLQNDVIVLFTDAEEPGQYRYGARLFAEEYKSLADVRLMLNFEALGRTGPSVLFETGDNSAPLIDGLSQSAANPVAFSFMSDLYRSIARDGTDFAVFDEARIPGLNFAYAFERTVYHTALDDVASVDLRSLQHHGDYALSLTRYFGAQDLKTLSLHGGGVVFHSLPGGAIIRYPTYWSLVLSIAAGILLLGLATLGTVRGSLNPRWMAIGTAFSALEVTSIVIATTLVWWGIDALHLAFGVVVEPAVKAHLFLIAVLLLCLTVMIATRTKLLKSAGAANVAMGTALFWWLPSLMAGLYLPGFSVVLTWPLLFSLVPLGWMVLRGNGEDDSWLRFGSFLVSTAVIVIVVAVPVYLFFQATGVSSPGFSGSPSFPIIGLSTLFWTMLLGLILPHVYLVGRVERRHMLLGLLAVAGVCLVAGAIVPGIPVDRLGLPRG